MQTLIYGSLHSVKMEIFVLKGQIVQTHNLKTRFYY